MSYGGEFGEVAVEAADLLGEAGLFSSRSRSDDFAEREDKGRAFDDGLDADVLPFARLGGSTLGGGAGI